MHTYVHLEWNGISLFVKACVHMRVHNSFDEFGHVYEMYIRM